MASRGKGEAEHRRAKQRRCIAERSKGRASQGPAKAARSKSEPSKGKAWRREAKAKQSLLTEVIKYVRVGGSMSPAYIGGSNAICGACGRGYHKPPSMKNVRCPSCRRGLQGITIQQERANEEAKRSGEQKGGGSGVGRIETELSKRHPEALGIG